MTNATTPYTQHLVQPEMKTTEKAKKSFKPLVIKAAKVSKAKDQTKANNRDKGDVGHAGAEVGEIIEVVDDVRQQMQDEENGYTCFNTSPLVSYDEVDRGDM